MPVIILRPRKTNPHTSGRPEQCPYCGSEIFQRWGEVTKPVRDKDDLDVALYRYRCEECKRTFRDYPEGIDRSDYSLGTRQIAALIWSFGYSYRDIVGLFKEYEITLSRSVVWREGQALAAKLQGMELSHYRRVFTIDKKYIPRVSSKFGVVVAVEVGSGRYAILGTLNEHNPRTVRSWLAPLVQDAEVKVIELQTSKLDLLYGSKTVHTGQLLA
jgi:DNA-directed RNA polymerase subunit RPC12/RpoP